MYYRCRLLIVSILTFFISLYSQAGVDLIIDKVVIEDSYFKVFYKNIGDGYGGYQYVQLTANGVTQKVYKSSPYPNQGAYYYFSFSRFGLSSGDSEEVTAMVDSLSYVTEDDETNNSLTVDFGAGEGSVPDDPDLSISEISYTEPTLKVKVHNAGKKISGSYTLRVYANGRTQYLSLNQMPEQGYDQEYTFNKSTFSFYSGYSYSVTASVDYYGQISESNESNNSLTKSIALSTSRADLVVSNIRESGSYIYVDIKNQGNASTTGYHYTYLSGNGYGRNFYSSALIGAGQTKSFSFMKSSFYINANSSVSMTAKADYYSNVIESNESNNNLTKTINFSSGNKPDLFVSKLTRSGDYIEIKIKNQGTMNAGGFYFKISTSDGYTRSYYRSSLAIGAETGIYISRGVLQVPYDETVSITVQADSLNNINESNENNNSKSMNVHYANASGAEPDLVITSVSRYTYSSYVYAKVTYKNQGTGNTTDKFKIQVVGNGRTYNYYSSLSVPSAGSSSTRYIYLGSMGVTNSGSYDLDFNLDHLDSINESVETNNIFSVNRF